MNRIPTVRKIAIVCANYYGMSEQALFSRELTRRVAHVRHVAAFVAVRRFGYTLTKVATVLDRDRTTLLHGCRLIQRSVSDDETFASEIDQIVAAAFEPISQAPPEPKVEAKRPPALTRGSIDTITRYRSRGFSVGRIARLTGLDELTVANVLKIPLWNGKDLAERRA